MIIPTDVMTEYRAIAATAGERPVSKIGAIAIVALWILLTSAIILLALAYWTGRAR